VGSDMDNLLKYWIKVWSGWFWSKQ
jgi:hypothetical protein